MAINHSYIYMFSNPSELAANYSEDEITASLMYRYESGNGLLSDDIETLVKYCPDNAENILARCLKYIREVYSSNSWQYYNILFEYAWVLYRKMRLKKSVDHFRAALVLNYDENQTVISPFSSYFLKDVPEDSCSDLDSFIDALKVSTGYRPGLRKKVMRLHLSRAARALESAGLFAESEAIYKKLCDEILCYGDVYGLDSSADLCRICIRMGEPDKAEGYCSAAERVLRDSPEADAGAAEKILVNRAVLLFMCGKFQEAYNLVPKGRSQSAFLTELKIDFELLFNCILYLSTGETRDSGLKRLESEIKGKDIDSAVLLMKLKMCLSLENKKLAPGNVLALAQTDMKECGSYIYGLFNYYNALTYAASAPKKAVDLLYLSEKSLGGMMNKQTGKSYPSGCKPGLMKSVLRLKNGDTSAAADNINNAGILFEWISCISETDRIISLSRVEYAAERLGVIRAMINRIHGTGIKLFAVCEYIKRYVTVYSAMGKLTDIQKKELPEYIRTLKECISYFGTQKDFGMSCNSSGDNEFLDDYLPDFRIKEENL